MTVAKYVEFEEEVGKAKNITAVKRKLKEEVQYLENACSSINFLKTTFTKYRNYLKQNLSPKAKIGETLLLPLLLDSLRLTKSQQQEFNNAKSSEIKLAKNSLRAIYYVDEYIKVASSLLDSVSYLDKIIGLCALTGRRAAEIACTAKFTLVNEAIIVFEGQLKTKERIDCLPYQIPVLGHPNKIVGALKAIRELKPQLIDNPTLFHDTASKDLSIRVKKHFSKLLEGVPKIKDLRAAYATICCNEFHKTPANRRTDRDVFFSRVLGHAKDDISTCASYVDFYIEE